MVERLNLSLFHITKDHWLSKKNESLYKTYEYMSKTNSIWEFLIRIGKAFRIYSLVKTLKNALQFVVSLKIDRKKSLLRFRLGKRSKLAAQGICNIHRFQTWENSWKYYCTFSSSASKSKKLFNNKNNIEMLQIFFH